MRLTDKLTVPRVLKRLGLLERFNIDEVRRLGGREIAIPIRNGVGFGNGVLSESWLVPVLHRLLKLAGERPFIDVGVNLGQTLLKLVELGFSGRYVGFEPNVTCASYATELIALNGLDGFHVVPAGLSDVPGIIPLYTRNSTDSSASMVKDFRGQEADLRPVFVSTVKLDDAAAALGIRDSGIVKVDVEGAELNVLKGARELLAGQRPFVTCEILPVYDPGSEVGSPRLRRQRELEELLTDLSYRMFRIDHRSSRLLPIETIGVHGDMELCDYVFAPRELGAALLESPSGP